MAQNLNLMVFGRLIQGVGGEPMTPLIYTACRFFSGEKGDCNEFCNS